MSHKTSLRVWEHSQAQRAARCLMLALADFANDDGICWPGTALLSKKINESEDYTDVIIKKCIDMGELVKHSGRGRGHPSRFAILCGLTPDEQKRLIGMLQKGYACTPLEKRGTAKGVIRSEKRGTFSDSNQASFDATECTEPPIGEKLILDHDPMGGGGGVRTLEKKPTGVAEADPLIALFARYDITQAEPLARLYRSQWPHVTLDDLTRLCEHLAEPESGSYAGARLYRKLKAGPYDRIQPAPSGNGARTRRANGQSEPDGTALPERGPVRTTLDY